MRQAHVGPLQTSPTHGIREPGAFVPAFPMGFAVNSDSFQHLCEVLAEIEQGNVPRGEVPAAEASFQKVSAAQIWAQAGKILASTPFVHSLRSNSFLRFIITETLAGRGAELKEYVIGIEVFGRKTDFDPRLDSIVRNNARILRSKLLEYYVKYGHQDPIVIEIPVGRYIPVFSMNRSLSFPRS
jgi:hypothetical protein